MTRGLINTPPASPNEKENTEEEPKDKQKPRRRKPKARPVLRNNWTRKEIKTSKRKSLSLCTNAVKKGMQFWKTKEETVVKDM